MSVLVRLRVPQISNSPCHTFLFTLQEAKERSQHLLEKAREQLEEQEDEIKKLNELILNAKCHAIRDAQLVEKVEIKKEVLDEEKRLDEMMENDRLKALQEYEQREIRKREERLRGAKVLKNQIEGNEMQRILDQNKKDLETAVSIYGMITFPLNYLMSQFHVVLRFRYVVIFLVVT